MAEEAKTLEEGEEELFDMLIPPGVPRSIIVDVLREYDVELVERSERMYMANMEGDARELLAFRGKREVVEQVQEYVFQKLREFIDE
ncbi:MAG: hypothetical protein RQ758_08185 [Methanomicrobiaceae archaeon]|nr:hypothetical protein [Methanomicrobiaceae archaeon]